MKKSIALFASVLILSSAVAFAVTAPTNTAGEGTFGTTYMSPDAAGNLTYVCAGVGEGVNFTARLSANVAMSLQKAADGSSYVVNTYHASGNKYYGTGSGDSRIFMKEITEAAADAPATPPTLADPVVWDGWTAVK